MSRGWHFLSDMFFDQTGVEMERLSAAAAAGDAVPMGAVAHKMVGSAMACGFVGLARSLRELELLCGQGLPDNTAGRIDHLARLIAEGRAFWECLLDGDKV